MQSWESVVKQATVRVQKGEAHGHAVLVPGELLLTAAHCVDFHTTGDMTLSPDDYRTTVHTADGQELTVAVFSVDPLSDIAVLGSVDGQRSYRQCEEFELFCEHATPVPVCFDDYELFKEHPGFVWTNEGECRPVKFEQCCDGSRNLGITADWQLQSGMSGGPVVNEHGCLVGIVSQFEERNSDHPGFGSVARPSLALPVWVVQIIRRAQEPGSNKPPAT